MKAYAIEITKATGYEPIEAREAFDAADNIRAIATHMLDRVRRGLHENPTLAVVGALNPPLGTAVELKYHRTHGEHPGWYPANGLDKEEPGCLEQPGSSVNCTD